MNIKKINEMLSSEDERQILDACIEIYNNPNIKFLKPLLSLLEKTEKLSPKNRYILRVCFKLSILYPDAINDLIKFSDKINNVLIDHHFYLFSDSIENNNEKISKSVLSKLIELFKNHKNINVKRTLLKMFIYFRIADDDVINSMMDFAKTDSDEDRWFVFWGLSKINKTNEKIEEFFRISVKNEKNPFVALQILYSFGRMGMKSIKSINILKEIEKSDNYCLKIGSFFSLAKFDEELDKSIDFLIKTAFNKELSNISKENLQRKNFSYELKLWLRRVGNESLLKDRKTEFDEESVRNIKKMRIKTEAIWALGDLVVDNKYINESHKKKIEICLKKILKNEENPIIRSRAIWSLVKIKNNFYKYNQSYEKEKLFNSEDFWIYINLNIRDKSLIEFLINKTEKKDWLSEDETIWAISKLSMEGRKVFIYILEKGRNSFYLRPDAIYSLSKMNKKEIPNGL
ncbi:MAG: hypothetical protein KJ613_05220 [Nanoarchaeota archaeon]|nr:hypothetical protein [Nanoarchaeota archaeon]MBU1135723.1 hypothetical protein [Nanoarchaeota archaeon]